MAKSQEVLLVSQRSWIRYPVWPHTFVSPSADSRGAVVSLFNRLEGLSLSRKSVVRLTGRLDMTLDVYRRRKTTTTATQQQQQQQPMSNDSVGWQDDRGQKKWPKYPNPH